MTGQRDQSSPDTTWPDGTMQQLARTLANHRTRHRAQPSPDGLGCTCGWFQKGSASRAVYRHHVDLQAARAVLAALGPVITEHYVPRSEHERLTQDFQSALNELAREAHLHEKLRADVLHVSDVVQRDSNGSASLLSVAVWLRALVDEDTPTKETP